MKHLTNLISILLTSLLISCGHKTNESKPVIIVSNEYDYVMNAWNSYRRNGTYDDLYFAYEALSKIKELQTQGMKNENYMFVFPILLELKKYEELLDLLEKSKLLNDYNKTTLTNLAKGLSVWCKDKNMANQYFEKNLVFIRKQYESTKDTLKIMDYYVSKLHLVPLDSVLIEVDRDRKNGKFPRISNYYFELIKKQMNSYLWVQEDCD